MLVAGGVLPPNPPQVIESQAMASLVSEAREAYDLVVIDTPPLVLLPDAFPLFHQADGVLIVSRLGANRRDVAVATPRHAGECRSAGHRRDRERLQATAWSLSLRLRIQLPIRLLTIRQHGARSRRTTRLKWIRPSKGSLGKLATEGCIEMRPIVT